MYYRTQYLDYFIKGTYDNLEPINPRIGSHISFKDYKNLFKPDIIDYTEGLDEEDITSLSTEEKILIQLCQRLNGRVITSDNSEYQQTLLDFINDSSIIMSYFPCLINIHSGYENEDTYEEEYYGLAINIRMIKGVIVLDTIAELSGCRLRELDYYYNNLVSNYEVKDTLYWPCYIISKVLVKDIYNNMFKRWISVS